MQARFIRVIYANTPVPHPSVSRLIAEITNKIEADVEIVHCVGDTFILNVGGIHTVDDIRQVLNKAFPNAIATMGKKLYPNTFATNVDELLPVSDDKSESEIIRVLYAKRTSIYPSSIAIMSELIEKLGIGVIDAHIDPGVEITLKLGGGIDINVIKGILQRAFPGAMTLRYGNH